MRSESIIVLAFFLLINSCGPMPIVTPYGKDQDARLFDRARRSFHNKDFKKALALYNEYLIKYPDKPLAPKAIMQKGEIFRRRKDYKAATASYQYLINKYAETKEAPKAMARILSIMFDQGKYQQLLEKARKFIDTAGPYADKSEIFLLMGDAYMALSSPVNAVYFYDKAGRMGTIPKEKYLLPRLTRVIEQLQADGILTLMERVKDGTTRGYLMYYLALKQIENKNYKDGLSTVNQFIAMFPDHDLADRAKLLRDELKERYGISGKKQKTIACLLPLSGSYKFYGNKALKGIELAIGAGNASFVNLIIKDTGSSPDQAVAAVKELALDNPIAIIGPIITARAAATVARDMGIVMITLTQKSGISQMGDNIFRNFITPEMQVKAVASYAVESLGLTRFAMLYPNEKYGITYSDFFQREIIFLGGTVTSAQAYDTDLADFRKPISKLAKNRDFEAIFIPDEPSKTGLILPQLAFYNITGVYLLGTNLWHSDKLINMAGKYAQGAVVPEIFFAKSRSPQVKAFIDDFKQNFGYAPGFIEALAYDTASMLIDVLTQREILSSDDLKKELFTIKDYPGVTGPTSFTMTGDADKKLYLLRIQGNGFVEIEQGM